MPDLPRTTRRSMAACAVLLPAIATTLATAALPADGTRAQPDPRQPLLKPLDPPRPIAQAVEAGFEHRLTVKFHDQVRARLDAAGRLISLTGVDTTAVANILGTQGDAAASLRPLINLPAHELARLEQEAAARSGKAQPDLAGMFIVDAPDADLTRLADALHVSDLVERVHFQVLGVPPPGWMGDPDGCVDALPFTDEYRSYQGYHDEAAGVGMAEAWAFAGGKGAGVKIADCEYGYRPDHEDLCDVTPEPGVTPHPSIPAYGWHEHGTAVLGEMVGQENRYGVTGLVPQAQASFFFEWTIDASRRVEAITAAVAAVDAGDVVLLEMQTFGPGGSYAPAELDPLVWTVTRLAADRGVCVVAAAGNGDQDLDSDPYGEYRNRGDSGAIIVGAGTSDGLRAKMSFSTYGSRVNLQAWGQNVFTAGYGDFIRVGDDPDQGYTNVFSGTSSASPIVASAVASLQGIHRAATGRPLPPHEVRKILMDSGRPQGEGGIIGPLPDMSSALDAMLAYWCQADFDGDGLLSLFDFLAFQASFEAGEPAADMDRDGRLTVFDFLAFHTAYEAGCR